MTASVPNTGTCQPWATQDDMVGACESTGKEELVDACLQFASDFLYLATGKRWPGICGPVTVRPCARQASSTVPALLDGPVPIGGGSWASSFNAYWTDDWGFCGCNREIRSGCSSVPEIGLGVDTIYEIDEVVVNGVVLDPSLYRVDDYRWLVRLRDPVVNNPLGQNPGWPCCQLMDLDLTHDQTWGVTFRYGRNPPAGGRECAALLACELSKAFDPTVDPKTCALPNRVTSVARQGVTMQMLNPLEVFSEGLTGIPFVDLWIRGRNPNRLHRRATVSSPDIGRRVRHAGTWSAP